jgi:predicted  nucleic acid-binding Zn-ribbon protein
MSEILGLNLSALRKSYDLSKMSKDYDKLATSIRNLSSSIQEINIEKLNALKTLTGSVVLMSLMDSEQFESMMDALEEKASTLVDVINQIDEGVSGKELKISSESDKKGATIEDLIKVMNRMDSRLGQIAATNNNISNYVNQLKANPKGGASMKNK